MPIQKFKFGQEITSSKLNEIVTFVNNLETFLSNAQYWNNNVDAKILVFQNQLTAIVNQINNVLLTAENFESLLAVFVDLKSKYETLIANNSQVLIETLFSPANMSIDANGLITLNGVNTGVIIKGAAGQPGSPGAAGTNGTNGLNGKTILTGSSNPTSNQGVDGDIFIQTASFNLYLKSNGAWQLLTNLVGLAGPTGPSGPTSLIEFRYRTNLTDTPYLVPNASTKYLEFKTYLSTDTNEERDNKVWRTLQIRSDGWYPIIETQTNGQILLTWSNTEPTNINPINIKGAKGDKGDTGSFVPKGIKANTGALPATGTTGEAWFVGAAAPYTVYLWDLTTLAWVNIGQIQGVTGPAPTLTASATTGNAGSSVTVTVTEPVEDTYNLAFSIPRGDTGVRGNRIYRVSDTEGLPAANPWVVGQTSTNLIVGDVFIVENTGSIQQVFTLNPFTLNAIFTLPLTAELLYRAKAIETISKGNLVQFVGVQGGFKLIANASQTQRTVTLGGTTYTVYSCNADPDLIMGVADAAANANSFVDVYDFGQITQAQSSLNYINNFAEGNKLWFDAAGATPGRLTNVEPTGSTNARILVAVYVGGAQQILQVRLGESKTIADIPGLQEAIDSKAASVHTHTIANVTNLQTTLDGKAASSHTHAVSDVTNLQAALDLKANLASPTFSGIIGGLKTLLWSGNQLVQENGVTINFNSGATIGNNVRFYVVWSFENNNVFYESNFTTLSLSGTAASFFYLSSQGWNGTTNRLEFYSSRFRPNYNILSAIEGFIFSDTKRWHLDGSFANSDDIVTSSIYIRAIYKVNF